MRAFINTITFEDDPNSSVNFQMLIPVQLVLDDASIQNFNTVASVSQDATLGQIKTAVTTAVVDSVAGYGFGVIPLNRILMPSFQRG